MHASLNQRLDTLVKWTIGLMATVWATTGATEKHTRGDDNAPSPSRTRPQKSQEAQKDKDD